MYPTCRRSTVRRHPPRDFETGGERQLLKMKRTRTKASCPYVVCIDAWEIGRF
jgi:hypothetical protein